jgi:hypothetical protein
MNQLNALSNRVEYCGQSPQKQQVQSYSVAYQNKAGGLSARVSAYLAAMHGVQIRT